MSRLTGGIRQLAMVVRDADATMRQWSTVLGVGPFIVVRNLAFENYRYRGRVADPPVVTLAFSHSGHLQIEIIQQLNDAPSAYTEFLASGREGCQHVAAWFSNHADYAAAYERLIANGLTLVHEARVTAYDSRFAYFESGLPGGLMIELAEAELPALAPIRAQTAALAANWDGANPIREYDAGSKSIRSPL